MDNQLAELKNYIDKLQNELKNYKIITDKQLYPTGIIIFEKELPGTENIFIINANTQFYALCNIAPSEKKIAIKWAFNEFNNFDFDSLFKYLNQPGPKKTTLPILINNNNYLLKLDSDNENKTVFIIEQKTEYQKPKHPVTNKILQIGSWTFSYKDNNFTINDDMSKMLQLQPGTTNISLKQFLQFIDDNNKKQFVDTLLTNIKTTPKYSLVIPCIFNNEPPKHFKISAFTVFDQNLEPVTSVGNFVEMPEQAVKYIENERNNFLQGIDTAPIGILLLGRDFIPRETNQMFCQMLEITPEIAKTGSLLQYCIPSEIETYKRAFTNLFSGGNGNFSQTMRFISKTGKNILTNVNVSVIDSKAGPMAILRIVDISPQQIAAEQSIISQKNYQVLIESSTDGIGLFDNNFKAVTYNTALYKMLGYTKEEYLSFDHSKQEMFHPDDKQAGANAHKKVLNGENCCIEKRLRNKQGKYQWFSIAYSPVIHNNCPGVLIFRRDISKQKEIEIQNNEYRLFLEAIMDNIPVALFAKTTPDFKYTYWNNTAEKLTGIPAEKTIGFTDFELPYKRSEAEIFYDEDLKLVRHKHKVEREHTITNTLGENITLRSIKVLHDSVTGNPMILGISMDITKMKETEQQLEQSSEMLKEAQKIANLGFWEYDFEKNLVFDNIENRKIFGTDKYNYFITGEHFFELIHPTDRDQAHSCWQNVEKTGLPQSIICRFITDKNPKHVVINVKGIFDKKNNLIKLRGTSLDITRIRQAEIDLRESETKLKQAERIAKVGYYSYDYYTKNSTFSDEVWNIIDANTDTKINGNEIFSLICPDERDAVIKIFKKARRDNLPYEVDFKIITRQNRTKYLKVKGEFFSNGKGELERSLGTLQDITEMRVNELEIKRITERLKTIQALSKTGYFECCCQTEKVVCSETLYKLLSIDKNQTIETVNQFYSFLHPDDKPTIIKTIETTHAKKTNHNIHYRIVLPNGNIKFINEICQYSPAEENYCECFIHIIQDISHIKEMNYELVRTSVQLQAAENAGLLGTWEYNLNTKQFTISDELAKIVDSSCTLAQASLKEIIVLVHPDDRHSVYTVLANSFKQKINYQLTHRLINQTNGNVKYVKNRGLFFTNQYGQTICQGTITDITEIRQTQNELFELGELFKAITENNIIGALIIQGNKHIYANSKWCNLVGIQKSELVNKATVNDVFTDDCAAFIVGLFDNWKTYGLKEYTNKINLTPKNAPAFNAEVFVKEVYYQSEPVYLIITAP